MTASLVLNSFFSTCSRDSANCSNSSEEESCYFAGALAVVFRPLVIDIVSMLNIEGNELFTGALFSLTYST